MGSRDDRNINRVIVKNNDMEAYLYLTPPADGERYDQEDIIDLLHSSGVREGISTSRISAMIKKGIYNHEQLIAEGTPPEAGVDGYFEFFFDATGAGKKHPLIRKDGTVDYTYINIIECVQAGDKLAVYHPAVKEKPGLSVKGKPIPGKRAKELPPLHTTGCTYVPEEGAYYADIEGRVEASKSKLSVTGLVSSFTGSSTVPSETEGTASAFPSEPVSFAGLTSCNIPVSRERSSFASGSCFVSASCFISASFFSFSTASAALSCSFASASLIY